MQMENQNNINRKKFKNKFLNKVQMKEKKNALDKKMLQKFQKRREATKTKPKK